MKTLILAALISISTLAQADLVPRDKKAIAASKTLYTLNIGSVRDATFKIGKVECDGGDTTETCTIEVKVKETLPTPGGVSYEAVFVNNNLSTITQNCPYCW